jgi:hypothetical protein
MSFQYSRRYSFKNESKSHKKRSNNRFETNIYFNIKIVNILIKVFDVIFGFYKMFLIN